MTHFTPARLTPIVVVLVVFVGGLWALDRLSTDASAQRSLTIAVATPSAGSASGTSPASASARAARARGVNAYDAGDYAAARSELRNALRLGLDTPSLRNRLGLAARRLSDDDAARRHWTAALDADSGYVPVLINLGVLESDQGRPDAAVAMYERAVDVHPTHPKPHFNLGALALDRDRPGEAALALEKAVRYSSGEEKAKALNNLGLAYERTHRLREAREAFDEAILIEPGYVRARMNLASVQPDTPDGRRTKARLYRSVLRLDTGHARARAELAALLGASDPASIDVADVAVTVRSKRTS